MNENVERIVREVLKSSKYQTVCLQTVTYLAEKESRNRDRFKDQVKAVKNRLHQIGFAYFPGKDGYLCTLSRLEAAGADPDRFRETCREVMRCHSSSGERLNLLDEFYGKILSGLPEIRNVADIACGLNPLTFPWFGRSGFSVQAYDIFSDLIDFLAIFLKIAGIQGTAETRDCLLSPPDDEFDLALILKSMPCFERLDRKLALSLLDRLNAKYCVVSYPLRSLCGREKNMLTNYRAQFEKHVAGKNWLVKEIRFETELVFIIRK
ncbi:MAG: hypothetical protein PHW04_16675 [Candidatus Wallbacteria bacterium]|nr:hypothetical protein [Candidatus Wallbacteria bacterium]